MTTSEPPAELDARFSSPTATPSTWEAARESLARAEIYWLTTVRSDGRPHVTPLVAVWQGEALYFCTGPTEQKAINLAHNAYCILTTSSRHCCPVRAPGKHGPGEPGPRR